MTITLTVSMERLLSSSWKTGHCFHRGHLLPAFFSFSFFLNYAKFNSRFWLDKIQYLRQKERGPEYDISSHLSL